MQGDSLNAETLQVLQAEDDSGTINDITVVEGQNSSAILTVTVNNPNPQPITVNYTTAPIDATANVDLRYLDYHVRHPDNVLLSENGVADARRSGNDDERGQIASENRGKTFDVMDDRVCY